jgi:hypothetical protein
MHPAKFPASLELYPAQGRHTDAEPLYVRSLMIQKKATQSNQK